MISIEPVGSFSESEKRNDCVSANEKAKRDSTDARSEIIDDLVRACKKARLEYDDLIYIFRRARKKLKVSRPKRGRVLPKVLSEVDLRRFFEGIQSCGNVEHEIMLKLIFFTALRVSELTNSERR